MTKDFASNFRCQLEQFIQQKHDLGFPYDHSRAILARFDTFCYDRYPNKFFLTREIAMCWAEKRPDEHVNTLIRRVTPIRQFAKYLMTVGVDAYVIPASVPGRAIRYVPHIYTKAELSAFFAALDRCTYNKYSPARYLVVPIIFRVLYCCGLRSSEVTGLLVNNVDLTKGTLTIVQSKANKDRVVVLAEDVLELCRTYHRRVSDTWPERSYFFPNHRGEYYSKSSLDTIFHEFWSKANIAEVSGNRPRVHDFRHTFAVNRLNQWVVDKRDINALLPYLSIYLGHAHLSETDYYLHLVPEFFPVLSAAVQERFAHLIPEVSR